MNKKIYNQNELSNALMNAYDIKKNSHLSSIVFYFPNNINIDTESARDLIADKLLETFQKKHIVFYTNLEKHNEEKNSIERGL